MIAEKVAGHSVVCKNDDSQCDSAKNDDSQCDRAKSVVISFEEIEKVAGLSVPLRRPKRLTRSIEAERECADLLAAQLALQEQDTQSYGKFRKELGLGN